ncbi:dipeptidase [Robiginitomaculum antarcticum]|uniref:dipeptidase n=1 Tax=Robiginitomaculum antarcticum TaxID=437507 RepID=UPI0003738137|nr:dipeptidase [Robiginitomaculum antarcticum]
MLAFKQILAVALTGLACAACGIDTETKTETERPSVNDAPVIHDKALVLDSHIDLELDLIADDMDPWSSGESRANIQKMQAGGMDGAFLIVFSPQGEDTPAGIATASQVAETRFDAISRLTEKHAGEIELALTAADARRIHTSGKRIALIGVENAFPFGHSTADVETWAARGVRYVGITHVGHNQFADSSNPSYSRGEKDALHGGLSPLGEELVTTLNEAGIIVDVSHASKAASLQAMERSKVPVIASHSGVTGVSNNLRNLDDEQLLALKNNGGVIHIVAYGPYLKDKTPEQMAFETKIRKEMGLEDDFAFMAMNAETEDAFDKKMAPAKALSTPANVNDLINHIDYVVATIGIDHVGIASDFDGGGRIEGWMDASETLNVTKALIARGYSEDDIKKIWSGNLLRVLENVQAYANP